MTRTDPTSPDNPTAAASAAPDRVSQSVVGSGPSSNPVADLFRINPTFNLFSAQAWTPTAKTGVYAGLGTAASSMVNAATIKAQTGMGFGPAFVRQLPGQPLGVFRDLALLGVNGQQIFENPIADVIAKGTIGSAAAIGSQELARRVLNPAANQAVTNRQVNRFASFLETGDERLLSGLKLADPDIRFDAPLNNRTIAGINFAVPVANLAVDSALKLAGNSGIPGLQGIDKNYWANLGGDAAAVCVGVAGPISIALKRPVWPACYYPAGQVAVATLLTTPHRASIPGRSAARFSTPARTRIRLRRAQAARLQPRREGRSAHRRSTRQSSRDQPLDDRPDPRRGFRLARSTGCAGAIRHGGPAGSHLRSGPRRRAGHRRGPAAARRDRRSARQARIGRRRAGFRRGGGSRRSSPRPWTTATAPGRCSSRGWRAGRSARTSSARPRWSSSSRRVRPGG